MSARGFVFVILMLISGPAFAQDTKHDGQSSSVIANDKPSPVDPTRNVLDLVQAAIKRQDDLRDMDRMMNELRYSSLKENVALRAEYEDKLQKKETSRLDAIRLVDTSNVAVATERANATAQALLKKGDDSALVLSGQATKNADDLVKLVKTTADEQSRNLQQQFASIQTQFVGLGTRLTALEQAGAEGIGKQKFQDPAQVALTAAVQRLIEAQSSQAGTGTGRGEVIAWIVGGLFLLIAIIGSVVVVSTFVTRSKATRR